MHTVSFMAGSVFSRSSRSSLPSSASHGEGEQGSHRSPVHRVARAVTAIVAAVGLAVGGAGVASAQDLSSSVGPVNPVNDLLNATGAPGPHRIPGVYFTSPEAPGNAVALGGQGISLYGPGTPVGIGDQICTIAAAGYDSAGRKIAITASHCGAPGMQVTSMDSPGVGPSGTVVRVSDAPKYAVIELGSNAQVTSAYGNVAAGSMGSGAIGLGTPVCKNGIATGWTCGPAYWGEVNGEVIAQVCASHGDSGAPLLAGDRIIGMVDRGLFPGSCVHPAQGMLFSPTVSVSMQSILDSMNAVGGSGQGFHLA